MNRAVYFLFAFILMIADQLSKWFVSEQILRAYTGADPAGLLSWIVHAPDRLSYVEIPVFSFFNWVMVWNQGVSFGMFGSASDIGQWLLIGLSFIITFWFGAWLFSVKTRLQALAIAMVIGGALGNAIDRFRFGAVIDFLDFHAFGWHYPAFNLADSCIVVGVIILMIYAVFFEKTDMESS